MSILDKAKPLFEGLTPDCMTHLDCVSRYNYNYYSINGNLLLGVSDDDNFTQWYWAINQQFIAIGGSYCSDDDKIIVHSAYT